MREIWTRKDLSERARLFLAASVGEMSVEEACQKLGISRQRFYKLEDRAVAEFLRAISPRPAGRPAKPIDPTLPLKQQLEKLEKENRKLGLYIKVLRKLAGIEDGGKKAGRSKKAARGRGKANDR
jgi:predicted ArsR family transcriptional regulator